VVTGNTTTNTSTSPLAVMAMYLSTLSMLNPTRATSTNCDSNKYAICRQFYFEIHLHFSQLFEAENANGKLKKLGKSNIALPSQTWEWSSVVEIDNGMKYLDRRNTFLFAN